MNDTFWKAVLRTIEDCTGTHYQKFESSPVYGGDINQAWCLNCGNNRFFIKTNRASLLSMFEAEKAGLEEIRESQSIRVPEVFSCGVEGDSSFIAMEYLDLSGAGDKHLLAQQLAAMHQHNHGQFGFHLDNTIGNTPQINNFSGDWIEFWRTHRLGFQLDLARENRLDKDMISAGEKLNTSIASFFTDYQPKPSLLHGDLWSGNQGSDSQNNPVIFDPACYYGDHEADLAMMELFGQPGKQFFDAYNEVYPIDRGYQSRRDLYNLYHILNHANLFGGGYSASARRLIDKLLSEV